MSGSEVIKRPSARVDTKAHTKSIRVAVRDFWRMHRSGQVAENPTRIATTELLPLPEREDSVDEIARKVFTRVQELPNGHEDPQSALFELTRQVIDEDATKQSQAVTPIATPSADGRVQAERLLKAAWEELSDEARLIMAMHVWDGHTFRDIARRLHMPSAAGEEHVLGVLKVAYAQLRARLSNGDQATADEFESE